MTDSTSTTKPTSEIDTLIADAEAAWKKVEHYVENLVEGHPHKKVDVALPTAAITEVKAQVAAAPAPVVEADGTSASAASESTDGAKDPS